MVEAPSANLKESLVRWRRWMTAPSGEWEGCGFARQVFRSRDADEVYSTLTQANPDTELRVLGRPRQVDAAFATYRLEAINIDYVKLGTEVVVGPGPPAHYWISVAMEGWARERFPVADAELAAGSAGVLPATQAISMHQSADHEQVAVRVDRSTLEAELSRMLCRDLDAPVVFDRKMILATAAGRRWAVTLAFVLDEIRRETGSLEHPLVRSRAEQLLIDQLLVAQPHNYTDEMKTGHRSARPPALRRAVEMIQARAGDPLTIPMLAELVGVSVRSLQQGFRDYLETTPLEYLREVRLTRARDDLLAADGPVGTSVTEVAYRWGFVHLARFAGYYKRRYGELPSETLHR